MLIPFGILSAAGAGGGVAGDYELIETTILGTSQTGITFSSLATYASTYKHLQIRYTARTSLASVADSSTGIRLNGDSGSNYSSHNLNGGGSTVTSNAFTSQTYMFSQALNGASATASAFGAGVIDLLDCYSTTKNKTLRWLTGATNATSIRLGSGAWLNTAAITSVTIDARDGSSYVAGSRFSIYGIKG